MSDGPVSIASLDWPGVDDYEYGDFRLATVAAAAGGEALGCSAYEVYPGDRTWRPHYHTGNEEAVYVLDGQGTIHLGPEGHSIPLEAGTYVALPEGPAGLHEIAPTAAHETDVDPLRVLVFSTMQDPDITVVPDDGKAILTADGPPGTDEDDRLISEVVDVDPPAVDRGDLPDPASLVVHSEDVEWTEYAHGERTFRRRQLAAPTPADRLGASVHDVPPGKRSWLRHWHGANEEALYVLEGSGTIRLGEDAEEYGIEAEDYVALPADERGTHEVTAGEDGVRYLAASEMVEPEVTVYPDRDMLGIYVGSATGGDPDERSISTYLDRNAEMDYWDE